MSGPDLTRARWRTSSRTANAGNCVEVAGMGGVVAVRDSKDRGGPVLLVDGASWEAFLGDIRRGDFDRH